MCRNHEFIFSKHFVQCCTRSGVYPRNSGHEEGINSGWCQHHVHTHSHTKANLQWLIHLARFLGGDKKPETPMMIGNLWAEHMNLYADTKPGALMIFTETIFTGNILTSTQSKSCSFTSSKSCTYYLIPCISQEKTIIRSTNI